VLQVLEVPDLGSVQAMKDPWGSVLVVSKSEKPVPKKTKKQVGASELTHSSQRRQATLTGKDKRTTLSSDYISCFSSRIESNS